MCIYQQHCKLFTYFNLCKKKKKKNYHHKCIFKTRAEILTDVQIIDQLSSRLNMLTEVPGTLPALGERA